MSNMAEKSPPLIKQLRSGTFQLWTPKLHNLNWIRVPRPYRAKHSRQVAKKHARGRQHLRKHRQQQRRKPYFTVGRMGHYDQNSKSNAVSEYPYDYYSFYGTSDDISPRAERALNRLISKQFLACSTIQINRTKTR